jgi:hypothetical protein
MRSICYNLRGLCTVFEKITPALTLLMLQSTTDKVSCSKRMFTVAVVGFSRFSKPLRLARRRLRSLLKNDGRT